MGNSSSRAHASSMRDIEAQLESTDLEIHLRWPIPEVNYYHSRLVNKIKSGPVGLKVLILDKCFDNPDDTSAVLSAVQKNGSSENMYLSLAGNKYNQKSINTLCQLIKEHIIESFVFPFKVDAKNTEKLLKSVSERQRKMKSLSLGEAEINVVSLTTLRHEIITNKKVKKHLDLYNCTGTRESDEKPRRLLEPERLQELESTVKKTEPHHWMMNRWPKISYFRVEQKATQPSVVVTYVEKQLETKLQKSRRRTQDDARRNLNISVNVNETNENNGMKLTDNARAYDIAQGEINCGENQRRIQQTARRGYSRLDSEGFTTSDTDEDVDN